MFARFVLMTIAAASAAADPAPIRGPESAEPLGITRQKLDLAYERLTSAPLDNPNFVVADLDFNLERRFTQYSGDVSGRLLGALGLAGQVLGREAPIADFLIESLPAKQQPDGHFGAPQNLDTEITQERDMPILWGNGRLLRAMAEQLRRTDDPELHKSAIALGDYVIATRPYYGKRENFDAVGGTFASGFTTCYPSLIDGLTQLGIITGEQRFLDEARFIASLSLADPEFDKRHSHGRLTAYRGMLELDLATGTRGFVAPVENGVKAIAAQYTFPTGGIPEIFDVDYDRDEGCSEADWVWVHLLLWQATRNPHYLDSAENIVRNHIYATQFANGGFGHYRFTNLTHGDQRIRGAGIENVASDSYWCCSMHDTQLLADLPSWGVVVEDGTLRVTWLAEVKAVVRVNAITVTAAVEEREPGTWAVTISSEAPVDLKLALRLPGWAAAMRIDGDEQSGTGGWVTLARAVESETTLQVELPTALRMMPLNQDEHSPVAVYSGPDLLCLPGFGLAPAFEQPESIPAIVLCTDRLVDAHLPALIKNSGDGMQQVVLGPMAKRLPGGCRYVFDVDAVEAPKFDPLWLAASPPPELGVPIRIQAASAGPYAIFVDGEQRFQGGGTDESPTVEVKAAPGERFVAIAAQANADPQGCIAQIRYNNKLSVTHPDTWRAYAFDRIPRAGDVTRAALDGREAIPIRDIGEFGIPPWQHVPGHFASTGAHWLWAAEEVERAPESWLVFATAIPVEANP